MTRTRTPIPTPRPMNPPFKSAEVKPPVPEQIDWRTKLTVDELRTVEQAKAYTEFRAGTQTNSPLTLIDKLAKLLDGE